MKISELRVNQSRVDVDADVTDVGEVRTFDRFGRTVRVATATIKDASGKMSLSLWNDDVDRIKKGDKIKVTNGFVKEFQGEKQLTAGKFGKIEVIGKGKHKEEAEDDLVEEAEEPQEASKEDSGVEEDLGGEEESEEEETEEVY